MRLEIVHFMEGVSWCCTQLIAGADRIETQAISNGSKLFADNLREAARLLAVHGAEYAHEHYPEFDPPVEEPKKPKGPLY